jgi:hypothetical protein
MSNSGNSIKRDPIREIAASAITGSYQTLGAVTLRDGFRLWITNNTNGDIYLSTDGVTDMIKMPATSTRAADDKTNDMYDIHGTQWYIRYSSVPGTPAGWAGIEVEYA